LELEFLSISVDLFLFSLSLFSVWFDVVYLLILIF